MKWLVLLLFVSISLNLFGQDAPKKPDTKCFILPKGISSKDYIPHTIILKFRSINAEGKISIRSTEIQALNIKSASIDQVKQLFDQGDPASPDKFGLRHIVEIKYSSTAGIERVINELLENPNVEYAEPSYLDDEQGRYDHSDIDRVDYSPHYPYANYYNYPPNDFYLDKQDYLEQVHAPEAWEVPIGSTTPVIIAIIDSGSQLNHEDLAANIYHNEADPINGIDDDHDGYIDNYNGWDFVGADKKNPKPDNDPNIVNQKCSHGVHISGLASAVTNNNKGIASIANNYAKLLILKVSDDSGDDRMMNTCLAIEYAANHGAKIINCSWGRVGYYSSFEQNVINDVISKDCLVIAAAGNMKGAKGNIEADKHLNQIEYPAAYNGVFAVANVSNIDQKSKSSKWGRHVSLSAPGRYIYSTIFDNSYGYMTGTSMATPIVASAAALVKAKFPSLTMEEVAERLKATADHIDSKNSSYRGWLGSGRLNIYRALTGSGPDPKPALSGIELEHAYPNPAHDYTNINFTISSSGQTTLNLYSASGKLVKSILNQFIRKGHHCIFVHLNDLHEGIYIYKLHQGNTSRSYKLLVDR